MRLARAGAAGELDLDRGVGEGAGGERTDQRLVDLGLRKVDAGQAIDGWGSALRQVESPLTILDNPLKVPGVHRARSTYPG